MNTCSTCEFWKQEGGSGIPANAGTCKKIGQLWDNTAWVDDDDAEYGYRHDFKPEAADRLAFANDGSGYSAQLITRPNFGCVMHVPS